MDEVWKDIKDFEGIYQISNMGSVRSLDRICTSGRRLKGKVLKVSKNKGGYELIALRNGGKVANCTVHRLVAQMFIDNPGNKPHVNHIDGNKTNNKVDNLEWVTRSENQQHAYNTGLLINPMKGKKHSIETRMKMSEINKRRLSQKHHLSKPVRCLNTKEVFKSTRDVERKYNIPHECISKCCRNKSKYAGRHPLTGEKMVWEYIK